MATKKSRNNGGWNDQFVKSAPKSLNNYKARPDLVKKRRELEELKEKQQFKKEFGEAYYFDE